MSDFKIKRAKVRVKTHFPITIFLAGALSIFLGDWPAYPASASPSLSSRLFRMEDEINEKGYSFTVGYNPALDYSREELCGLKEPPDWRRRARVRRPRAGRELPSKFDWRDYGVLPPIRDQEGCGSCWAFGSVSPLEANILWKDDRTEIDLSEQWLVSCNRSGWDCGGGWWAHDYHGGKNPRYGEDGGTGAVPEEECPYTAQDDPCGGPYNHPYLIDSWHYISYFQPEVEDIKEAIYTYGPVPAAIHIGIYFQAYTGGIFDYQEAGVINHAVVLVGWNDDDVGGGYWILRNSWGEDWGEEGYMRIRYGTSQVGYSAHYLIYPGNSSPEGAYSCRAVSGDYDGDGKDDIALFRPSSGMWCIRGQNRCYFGTTGDIPVPADYNGNGTTEIAVYRESTGLWAVRDVTRFYFGSSADTPVPGDYDGDGSCEAAIFREKTGLWVIRGVSRTYFGDSGDTPLTGDFNGDGTAEPAIWRKSSGLWALKDQSRFYFGGESDLAAVNDYQGDGTSGIALFRPSTGLWAIRETTRSYFGGPGDKPVAADYDGAGAAEIAVFRDSNGLWAVSGLTRCYFGEPGDIPATR